MSDPLFITCLLLFALGSINSTQIDDVSIRLKHDATLVARLDQLEAQVRDQELKIHNAVERATWLEEKVKRLESLSITTSGRKSRENEGPYSAIFMPRTCQEAFNSNLPEFEKSGMYWIDPDGLEIGLGPIYVYCNMSTGVTLIGHDSESTMPIPRCSSAGCYSRSITYRNTSPGQLKALTDISAECRQSIQVNCVGGPLTLDKTDYAWWDNVDGKHQNYWSGSSNSEHICQCGIDGNCIDKNTESPKLKCNCDANVAVPLSDNGVITLKQDLPVTKLNFGKISFDGGSHKLGKLECSGKSMKPNQLPTSCQDLWRIGHTLNGFYPVRNGNKIQIIHCDFTQGQNVAETSVGLMDVKSAPIHFYVQRSTSFSEVEVPISFDKEILNEGNAMDSESGIFTAPKSGLYLFDFSGVNSGGGGSFSVDFYINNEKKGSCFVADSDQITATLPMLWHLNAGDHVWLSKFNPGTLYSNDKDILTHFTGLLLEEDMTFL